MSAALGPSPVVILCRPQIGENAGSAARAMLNFGLTELRLVAPEFGWPNAKAVAAASGASAVMNAVRIVSDLPAALDDIHHLYALTARRRELIKPVIAPAAAVAQADALMGQGRRVAFLFGPERTGLTNEEAALADALVTIPTNPRFSSLNLAQSVLVLAYEWGLRRWAGQADAPPLPDPASKAEVQGLIDHLLAELDAIDFFRAPDRRVSLSLMIAQMLERRAMTTAEVDLMRGIVRDLAGGRRATRS
jgi:tRNA/rRNA methyltransferase